MSIFRKFFGRGTTYPDLPTAVGKGDVDDARKHLAQGADPNVGDEWGIPLHRAASWGDLDMARLLLEYGADVNLEDRHGESAFHHVREINTVEMYTLLIEAGANINAQTSSGTILHHMLRAPKDNWPRYLGNRYYHVVEYLAGTGIDLSLSADHGGNQTPLHVAVEYNDKRSVQILLNHGADPNVNRERGLPTPLHTAAEYGHLQIAVILLEQGADVNARTEDGWTPLHFAGIEADFSPPHMEPINADLHRLLLERGADVNARTTSGWTPLMMAVRRSPKDVIECLIANGADAEIKTEDGRTPLDWARENTRTELYPLLGG
jgi:ankyrin repeat protein